MATDKAMRFDLHIHSRFSYDSLSQVGSLVKHAQKCGLNGIAITDHNVFKYSPSDFLCNEKFWLIPGSEIHTEFGDIIGLFLHSPLKYRKALDLIKEIHDQNGISILAHPFKRMQVYSEDLLLHLDAIEVVNSRWIDLNMYKHNKRISHLLQAVSGRSAGSDSHFLFELGRGYLKTPPINSLDDLKKIICHGEGNGYANSFSSWLDEASQFVNFYKRPSFYQGARIFYRAMRRVIKGNPVRYLNEKA